MNRLYFKELFGRAIEYHANRIVDIQNNLSMRLKKKACDESIEYIEKNMKNTLCFNIISPSTSTLKAGLNNVIIDGLFLEFGVSIGETTKFIAKKINPKILHGFDSFDGLPENWFYLEQKAFSTNGKIPNLPRNVKIHKGLFKETLKDFEINQPISFLHIDCDLYSSTKTIFEYVGKNLVKDSIIVFDEYMNHPYWQEHEFMAFQEFVKENNVKYDYLAFSGIGQVCLRITNGVTKGV